jgi:hypothetical protein
MLRAVINAGNKRQGKSMTTMTAGGARTWWCAALLAVAGATCGGELPPPERSAAAPVPASMQAGDGGPCVDDNYCISRFCDRGSCAEPVESWSYGSRCDPNTTEEGIVHDCGVYFCIDGRCRSCQSGAECKAAKGPPLCVDYRDRGHGKRCGSVEPDRTPRPPAEPPTDRGIMFDR